MKLKKFEQKKLELEKKFQEELAAIKAAEERERQKLVEPVIAKISKAIEDELRKRLNDAPEMANDMPGKKREILDAFAPALESLFDKAVSRQDEMKDPTESRQGETLGRGGDERPEAPVTSGLPGGV